MHEQSLERQANIAQRRSHQNNSKTMANNFRKWFLEKRIGDEVMDRKCRQQGLDWQIQVAVILERGNVVQPDMEDWEIEYQNLKSHIYLHTGKEYPKEISPPMDLSNVALTQEELMTMLPPGFQPAPRVTADEDNLQSTNRKLKTNIFLTLNGDDGLWRFPTVDVKPDETLLEAAKRSVSDHLGNEVDYWTISNAPLAVDMEAFEIPTDGRLYGRKTFFLKIYYDEGEVSSSNNVNYAWLDRQEMVERVQATQGERMGKFYHYLL